MKAKLTLAIAALLCAPASLASEEDNDWIDTLLTQLGSSETVDHTKLIDWGVLPGPFVNPEQGLGIGVAAVGLYRPMDWQTGVPYSTLTVTSYGSTSGSYGLGINNRTYLQQDSLRLLGEAWISHEPGYYWGIGKQSAQDNANKTPYQGQKLLINPKFALEVADHVYVKAGFKWHSYRHMEEVDNKPLVHGLTDATSSGVVLGMEFDSRDFEPNPSRGQFIDIEWIANRGVVGSEQSYDHLTINARHYAQFDANTVLAMEVYSQSIFGDAPWFDYAQLGDDKRMRGYYQGQYRDKHQLSTQIELRRTLTGRHGMVAWLGAGNVAPSYQALFEDRWLPSIGVGYRFAFKARINVRVDLGVGKESSGFYFQVNEAF
ncbi:BamA/TamA family outer membrane protein [Vibrio sp. NH-7]